ncbi:MAG TPA: SPOR domain-containing protein [Paludibacteraceae bacterium]|nr:SPOR domain-containing protein [Paludibacteraceae bacterium]
MKIRNFLNCLIILSLMTIAFSGCKSKQKVTEIPGANVKATTTSASTTPSETTAPVVVTTPPSETETNIPEVTRKESFNLAEGETNHDALSYKYHVVVGSFKNLSNAKGLQSTLKQEGNNSLIVINEQGMYRVIIDSFNDYNQAHARINQIKNRFPDAWVLIQK